MLVDGQQILIKLYKYCAYQERCRSEIIQKLKEWKVEEKYYEEILNHLEEERFWNESRYAETFARGKFSVKKWGRQKIRHHLQLKQIPRELIQVALKDAIDEEAYIETLRDLASKKNTESNGGNSYAAKSKLYRYLYQKGYESHLINEVLQSI